MKKDAQNHSVTVVAASKEALMRELDIVIDNIRKQAITGRRQGILIKHEAPGRSSVALSDDVPFGVTQEKLAW